MKNSSFIIVLLLTSFIGFSQNNDYSNHGFRSGVIAGGSLNLGLANNYSIAGASPFLGAALTRHIDIGVTYSFNFASVKDDVNQTSSKKNVYGPGAFVKIYPLSFLFIEGQYEYNTIEPNNTSSGTTSSQKLTVNSYLMGGGLTFGRNSGNRSYFYCSALWDLADNQNSPYKNVSGKVVPLFRAGVNISLSGGGNHRQYGYNSRSSRFRSSGRVVVSKWSGRGHRMRW